MVDDPDAVAAADRSHALEQLDEREPLAVQRDRQAALENELLSVPAMSWPDAAAKVRYVLNLYAAGLSPDDARHRDLVAAIFEDFARLSQED